MRRLLAIEEAGTEHLPPEPAPEEKPRFLLQRIEFEQSEEKDAKKAKSNKEAVGQLALKWPWQGLVENLQQAHQELSIILDFLTHVEANDAITVSSMVKPKPLSHEACSELALRASVKLHDFKKVGKYLKQTAKALEQQVEREAIFYGALMRLQRHWKVKRHRSISAGPGGNAGFTIDLSYPQLSTDLMSGVSSRTTGLYTVNVEQDSSGVLMAHLPGHHINALQMHFHGPYTPHSILRMEPLKDSTLLFDEQNMVPEHISTEKKPWRTAGKGVGEAVNEGARVAHSILRCIQTAVFDEEIFEWTVREALQPSSGVVVTSIQDNNLQLSLGHASALVLKLSKIHRKDNLENENTDTLDVEQDSSLNRRLKTEAQAVELDDVEMVSGDHNSQEAEHANTKSKGPCATFQKEMSAIICLQESFHNSAFVYPQVLESSFPPSKLGQIKTIDAASASSKPRDLGSSTVRDPLAIDAGGPLKRFSLIMRHRVFSSRVLSELEKLVKGVPYLFLSFHPVWHSRVSAWDLRLEIPQPVVHGWKMKLASWSSAKEKSRSKSYFKVILCNAMLSVEHIEQIQTLEGAITEKLKLSKYRCDLTELSSFLLYQLAGQLVQWLHEEALVMGLKVRRDLLSLFFHLSSQDVVVIVASLDVQAYLINWWLQLLSPKVEDVHKDEVVLGKNHTKKLLGPLNLETLRAILVDFLNVCSDNS